MSKDKVDVPENDDEDGDGFLDWFEESAGFWMGVAVLAASIVVPAILWIATQFFGWEPPEFIAEWIDYFAA